MSRKRRLTPEEIAANKARANRKRLIRRLWKGEYTLVEICEEMGMGEAAVLAFAESLGLGERVEVECYLPSREEIRLSCAKIRAGWTQAEREARRAAAWSARMDIGPDK